MTRGASASRLPVARSDRPGARRARKRPSASISTAKPAGKPSITQPTDGAWDCPNIVIFSRFPKLFDINTTPQFLIVSEKARVGFFNGLRFNRHRRGTHRGGKRRGHGDPVVAARVRPPAGKTAPAQYTYTVAQFGRLRAELGVTSTSVVAGLQAVALLEPEPACVCNDGFPFPRRKQDGKNGDKVRRYTGVQTQCARRPAGPDAAGAAGAVHLRAELVQDLQNSPVRLQAVEESRPRTVTSPPSAPAQSQTALLE